MKNERKTKNILQYNFGIRKPVLNCNNLLKNFFWKNCLIDKWIYMQEPSEYKKIYIKHMFKDQRVYQIIYSGTDILGDGLYILYKVNINYKNNDFWVVPEEFSLIKGSFESEDYLKELLDLNFIKKWEYNMFLDKERLDEYTKKLYEMKEIKIF